MWRSKKTRREAEAEEEAAERKSAYAECERLLEKANQEIGENLLEDAMSNLQTVAFLANWRIDPKKRTAMMKRIEVGQRDVIRALESTNAALKARPDTALMEVQRLQGRQAANSAAAEALARAQKNRWTDKQVRYVREQQYLEDQPESDEESDGEQQPPPPPGPPACCRQGEQQSRGCLWCGGRKAHGGKMRRSKARRSRKAHGGKMRRSKARRSRKARISKAHRRSKRGGARVYATTKRTRRRFKGKGKGKGRGKGKGWGKDEDEETPPSVEDLDYTAGDKATVAPSEAEKTAKARADTWEGLDRATEVEGEAKPVMVASTGGRKKKR